MSIHKKLAHLSMVAIFLVVLALLHQHNSASINTYKKHNGLEWPNGSLPTSSHKGTRWTAFGRWKPPSTSSVSKQRARPSKKLESEFTRTLVVPRVKDDDISWIAQELPDLDVVVYVANDPSAPLHSPKNKGNEVMVYLTYIIDHYDELPDVIIFMHAHRWTHHNNELLGYDAPQMIRRLSNAHVTRQGYVNMRCHWSPGCPEWLHPGSREEALGKQEEAVLVESWAELFPSDPIPKTLAQPCCAQFALSGQRIHSIPLSRFTFFRDWILRTPLSDYISGRIWEYSWQYLFTRQNVSCPAEHICYCDAFGVCFGGAINFNNYEIMRRAKLEYEAQINVLLQQAPPHKADENWNTTNASGMLPVESDKYSYLHRQVEALDKELVSRKRKAIEQGNDPRKRAQECGRQWDGF